MDIETPLDTEDMDIYPLLHYNSHDTLHAPTPPRHFLAQPHQSSNRRQV